MCDYIDADLREPQKILEQSAATLDFTRPIALMLLGILHHITNDELVYTATKQLVDALPPGSFIAINHATNAVYKDYSDKAAAHWNQFGTPKLKLRSPEQIERFFTDSDLTLLDPGITTCSQWRTEGRPFGLPDAVDEFCGVGVKG
jgi:O-methyltransferase involved in polyketide biosynthesis